MRAITVDAFDAPIVMREVPVPEPAPGEVRIRVRAAGVNTADRRLWHGAFKGMQEHVFPLTLGFDMAGVVDLAGPGVTRYREGDEVYGTLWKPILLQGTFADYVVSPADSFIARKPASLDFVKAAAVPMGGQTALVAVDSLGVSAGETLLIVGATGSVGTFAAQIASRRGARVIATARPAEQAYVRDIGATEIVDYTAANLVQALRGIHPNGIDAVLDLVSNAEELAKIADLLRRGGRLATTLYVADPAAYRERGIEATNIEIRPGPALLDPLRALIDEEQLLIPIARTFPLEEAAGALEYAAKAHPLGHVVLTVS